MKIALVASLPAVVSASGLRKSLFGDIWNPVLAGRYIKIQYDHVECGNLEEILVYGSEFGPNLITPNTPVSKSSGYRGDTYPGELFVDGIWGNDLSIVHTSCYDVSWFQIDMGAMVDIHKVIIYNRAHGGRHFIIDRIIGTKLLILNDQNEVIYTSDAIESASLGYMWLPGSDAQVIPFM